MKSAKSLPIVVAVVVLLVFLMLFPFISDKSDWTKPPLVFARNIVSIRIALHEYQSEHNGRLPSRLSELVPNYIQITNIQIFFWPPKTPAMFGSNPESLSDEIDNRGAFVYLGQSGLQEDIILYESTKYWSDSPIAYILTTNLVVMHLPTGDIQTRLKRIDSNNRP